MRRTTLSCGMLLVMLTILSSGVGILLAAPNYQQPRDLTPTPTLPPGANAWTDVADQVRLRSGPGLNYAELDLLDPRTPLRLVASYTRLKYSLAEPDNTWYLVRLGDGRYGWVYSDLIGTILPIPRNPPCPAAPACPAGCARPRAPAGDRAARERPTQRTHYLPSGAAGRQPS